MFQGHQFVKLLNDNWVIDLTEFKGYKLEFDKDNNIKSKKLAFIIYEDTENKKLNITKKIRVPVNVMREAVNFITEYEKSL